MFHALDKICRATSLLLLVCMTGMTLIMVSLVVSRYLFSYSPSWSEEATRYLMVWLVMSGGAVLVLFDDHITLHVLTGKLGPRGRCLQGIAVRTIIAAVAIITAWTGFEFSISMWDIRTSGSGLSLTVPTMAIPVSMTLIALFSIIQITREVARLAGGTPMPVPQQSKYMDGSFKPAEDSEA